MRTIWSGMFLGNGIGLFGRFAIALVIISLLKSADKNNPRLAKGQKTLIVLGIICLIVMAALFGLWLFGFGSMLLVPSIFGHIYY